MARGAARAGISQSQRMKCTCPTHYTESGVQRFAADALCPVHGTKSQPLPHCPTCTCQVGSPIVQTPSLAANQTARPVREEE